MITTYFRSSSYNTHDMCPLQYYIEYNLGWRGDSSIKADKGTIVHKVLEVMALCKKAKQEKKKHIKDDICGTVPVTKYNINELTDIVYKHYVTHVPQHNWRDIDRQDCKDWVWLALQYNDGQFDPRNKTIIDAEPFFDIEIQEPWAAYDYNIDGKNVKGFFGIKGTIDLITKVQPNIYEIIDWKSGGYRKNWVTGKDKELEDFYHDPQLLMYHYAAHKLYNVDQIIVTIFFIRAGGPYTVCFDSSHLKIAEDMLKKKFEEVRADQNPIRNSSWKCTKFCTAGKKTFEGTHIKPMQEFRRGQVTPYGKMMTRCEQVKFLLGKNGMPSVDEMYTMPGHDVMFYKNPGSVE